LTADPAVVRNISDTALWAAYFRAEETRRPDAMFRDPYAEKLATHRATEIASSIPQGLSHSWAWVARTYLFDQLIEKEIADGADLIVNCAAGLDARPYRMNLPANLQWIEADLPEILAYKTDLLAGDKPSCNLERIAVNLADVVERRRFLEQIANRGKRGVVLTEGLLIYLQAEQAAQFADAISGVPSLQRWIFDMHSPRLLKMMQRETGKALEKVGAPFVFGPAEGPDFFLPHGWQTVRVESLLKTAARFGRPPLFLRFFAKFLASQGWQPNRPFAGVCLLQKNLEAKKG
jgi:methyltransferase (TIGR00027 family)